MPDAVVDASAIGALLFDEDGAEDVRARIAGATLVAPALLGYEIANVAAMKVRRGDLALEGAAAALEIFARIDLRVHAVDARAAFDVASETGLTAYDAAYLWLARALGAELVTLDRQLARAARAEGT